MVIVEVEGDTDVGDRTQSIRVAASLAESLRIVSVLRGESIQAICSRLMKSRLDEMEADALRDRAAGKPSRKTRRKRVGAGESGTEGQSSSPAGEGSSTEQGKGGEA